MANITIVIPVCETGEELKKMFKNAIGSIPLSDEGKSEYPVMVIGPEKVISSYKDKNIEKVVSVAYVVNEKSGFQDQINAAAEKCETPYFCILEIDDTFNRNWFKNVEEHIASMPETPFFIPLTELYDLSEKEPTPIGFANTMALTATSDKIGYLGIDDLMTYSDFSCTGGVFRAKDFIDIGGLKPSLKLVFWHEFLFRAAENHKEVYVIPKLGYRHHLRRPGSLMDTMSKTVTEEEAKFWFETARKEYHFTEDRKKVYTPPVTKK